MLPPRVASRRKPAGWWSAWELPTFLQDRHCKRVANFALMVTVLIAVVVLLDHLAIRDETARSRNRGTQAVAFVISAALYLVARSPRFSHSLVLKLSLVYEVLLCAVLSVGAQWFTASVRGTFVTMTLTCLVVAIFPLIVPTPPLHTFITALASAATGPLALTFVGWMGILTPRLDDYIVVSIFHTISVAIAVHGSRLIYGLNRDVAEARELGSYRIEAKLGEGGMGAVYRASHVMMRRPSAIKLVRPDEVGETSLARFEREAQLTARLTHPNTVTIFDYGRTPEGVFYYAMELLDGATLERIVHLAGPFTPGRTVKVLAELAGALEEAHGIGLIHRDIKPSNVILCTQGGKRDVAKLLDFGLVKELGGTGANDLTKEGSLTGTPQYMCPEALTAPETVDARSDLYALGAVGYFMLTGKPVFEGATVVEVCAHHLHTKPVPPSKRLGQPVPQDLELLLLCCLEKNPADRPQSAADLSLRLAACQSMGEWTEAQARRWWDRHGESLRPVIDADDDRAETIEKDLARDVPSQRRP